jgi:hypothetical protein
MVSRNPARDALPLLQVRTQAIGMSDPRGRNILTVVTLGKAVTLDP